MPGYSLLARALTVAATIATSAPPQAGMFVGDQSCLVIDENSGDLNVSTDSAYSFTRYASALPSGGPMAHKPGLFVALRGAIPYTSPDGHAWTAHAAIASAPATWSPILTDGTTFVVAGYGTSDAWTSTDGITWTHVTLPASGNWVEGAWSGSAFCFMQSGGATTTVTSADGASWAAHAGAISADGNGIARLYGGGGTFYLLTNGATVWTSSDGAAWTSVAFGGSYCASAVWTGSTLAIHDQGTDQLYVGTASWSTAHTLPLPLRTARLHQAANITYLAVPNGGIYVTADLASWYQRTYSGSAPVTEIIDVGTAWIGFADVGAGEALALHSTTRGASWTVTARLPAANIGTYESPGWLADGTLAWDGADTLVKIASGYTTRYARSTDRGATWSVHDLPALNLLGYYQQAIVWSGTAFVVIPQTEYVQAQSFRSADAISWNRDTTIPTASNRSTLYANPSNGVVVFEGNGGHARTTDNGQTWGAVDGSFVIAGFDGEAFVSTSNTRSIDAVSWTATTGDNPERDMLPYKAGEFSWRLNSTWNGSGYDYQTYLCISLARTPLSLRDVALGGVMPQALVPWLFVSNDTAYALADGQLYTVVETPDVWNEFAPASANRQVSAYSNGVWLSGGDGALATSPDGTTLTSHPLPAGMTAFWQAIALPAGGFVGLFSDGTSMFSAVSGNGADWTLGDRLGAYAGDWDYSETLAVSPGGRIVACHSGGRTGAGGGQPIAWSDDGLHWNYPTIPIDGIAAGGGYWRAGHDGTVFMVQVSGADYLTSPDAVSWTAHTVAEEDGSSGMGPIFGLAGRLVISFYNGRVYTNDAHGVGAWTLRATLNLGGGTAADWFAYDGQRLAAVGWGGNSAGISSDLGTSWGSESLPASGSWYCLGGHDGRFVTYSYGHPLGAYRGAAPVAPGFWAGFIGCTEGA